MSFTCSKFYDSPLSMKVHWVFFFFFHWILTQARVWLPPAFPVSPVIPTPTSSNQWLLPSCQTGSLTPGSSCSSLLILPFQLLTKTAQLLRSLKTHLLPKAFLKHPFLGVFVQVLWLEKLQCVWLTSQPLPWVIILLFILKCCLNLSL